MLKKNFTQRLGKLHAVSKLILFCSLWLALSSYAQADTARGVVFDDRNANGSRDSGEPGLAGVHVSNGREIVATDHLGNYAIEVDDDMIVFVIKPRDWQTQIDKRHIPRFYYIHKPKGSPDEGFKFLGVEPTGPLPESIDFPLIASPDPEEFTVIFMGDPQPTSKQEVRFYANDVIVELVDTKAAFGMSMGDIVGNDLSLFEAVNDVQGVVGVPWYNVHGNHDMNFQSPNDKYADETFERVYGPTDYAFQYGDVHFVVLDNVHWNGVNRKPGQSSYKGEFREQQLEFVANYLSCVPSDDRFVICTHIPLDQMNNEAEERAHQYRRLLEILSSHPYTMSFSAHTHINDHHFAGAERGYLPVEGTEHHHHNVVTGSGSWWRGPRDTRGIPLTPMSDGAPNGYMLATFRGNKYQLRYKAAHMPEAYQMAIYAPEVVDAANSSATKVVANIFNGSVKSKVKMRVRGHSDWTDMEHAPQADPAYAAMHKRDVEFAGDKRRPLPDPKISKHIWAAQLPPGLQRGVHVLEVESTDMFGQLDYGLRLIEVDEVAQPATAAK